MERIREQLRTKFQNNEFVIDKTGVLLIEVVNASFDATDESLFGEVNYEYVGREIDWYKSMSLNINDIPQPIPEIWKKVGDKDGVINSNYGWCIYHPYNYSQFKNVVQELKLNPESRRAIMIYTRPSMWVDFDTNGRCDFMCTNTVQYLVRGGALTAIVSMRSNDAVFGYKNDRAWQKYVQSELANELGIDVGPLYWNVGSLHVYERHFNFLK